MKKIVVGAAALLFAASCAGGPRTETTPFMNATSVPAASHYNVWKSNRDGSAYQILFYGKNGSYREVSQRTSGSGESSGAAQTIYYKNLPETHSLESVLIMATYQGNPEGVWRFTVEDVRGMVLYASSDYRYAEFPHDRYAIKEFPTAIAHMPHEFFIKVFTGSNKDNGLHVLLLASDVGEVYSYRWQSDSVFEKLDGQNYSIFPKLK